MKPYDKTFAPKAFGQHNTGVICYFNSFMQTLAACTSFTQEVLQNIKYLQCTATGTAVVKFVMAYSTETAARETLSNNIEFLSASVLHALVSDLAIRRPHVQFGGGQESASEALVHLLDMMELPSVPSPITNLFLHRFRCNIHCCHCKNIVSKTTDYAVNFELFHIDKDNKPMNIDTFSKAIQTQVSITEDYKCPECLCCGIKPVNDKCLICKKPSKTTSAYRTYNLTMVPEIVFCMFNLYVGFGGSRHVRYFPETLEFPSHDGSALIYNIVSQIEHAGSLSGGHYWARSLRANNEVFTLNDNGVSLTAFTPTANTYIVVYHYFGKK